MKHGLKVRFLTLIIATTISLFIAEILYRAYLQNWYKIDVSKYSSPLYKIKPNSLIEYSIKPNLREVLKIPNQDNASIVITTNSEGFRGKHIEHKKTVGKRIMFLGDSYTFGWAVNDNETYPARLEVLLNRDKASVESTRVQIISKEIA